LLKETMGAFDGAQTHTLHITSQTCNPLRHRQATYCSLSSGWFRRA